MIQRPQLAPGFHAEVVPQEDDVVVLFSEQEAQLLRGRLYDARDAATAPPVVVISERLAERHWPGADPLGKRLRLGLGFIGKERMGGGEEVARPYGVKGEDAGEGQRPRTRTQTECCQQREH